MRRELLEEANSLRLLLFLSLLALTRPGSLSLYRLAHPGGPLKTNKAAALAKFLERKLQDPNGSSIDPDLIELAVKNARATVTSSEYYIKTRLFDEVCLKVLELERKRISSRPVTTRLLVSIV
ncbi:hypothetical protein F2Q68_00022433 [Brassica cretica]|uniref:Uncharacterized protein n=1 Tax=Brassica cretica TaxID=69181 RepID=A0A8S9FY06_BRACR|nr:hypothetical protein F2Q68_00022433 [Brassica cretica]